MKKSLRKSNDLNIIEKLGIFFLPDPITNHYFEKRYGIKQPNRNINK